MGETVKIVKEGGQKGKEAVIVDPDWKGIVKVKMEDGTTKSYTNVELRKSDSGVEKIMEDVPEVSVPVASPEVASDPLENSRPSAGKGVSKVVSEASPTSPTSNRLEKGRRRSKAWITGSLKRLKTAT